MRTNKNCPKYGDDSETRVENTDLEKLSVRPNLVDQAEPSQQKPLVKKLVSKTGTKVGGSEALEDDKPTSKAKILKVKCGASDKLPERHTPPNSQSSDRPIISDAETGSKSVVKVNKITFSNKMKSEDVLVEPAKPSIVIKPPVDGDRDQPRKKIIIRQQPKEIISLDDNSQDGSFGHEHRKTKKIIELSNLDKHMERGSGRHFFEESSRIRDPDGQSWGEQRRRIGERQQDERYRRAEKLKMIEDQSNELLRYEESIRREREEEEHQRAKAKKKKRKPEMKDDYLDDFPPRRNDRRIPDRDRIVRRRVEPEYGKHASDFAPASKRRRGGEVSGLFNQTSLQCQPLWNQMVEFHHSNIICLWFSFNNLKALVHILFPHLN